VAAHPSDEAAIEIDGLRKCYPRFRPSGRRKLRPSDDVTWAVRGLSLHVRSGEIFAFLGPNGAGKTTTVEIMEGFRRRDGGDVRVLGVDPEHGDRAWRARIGIVLQEGKAQPELTVRETLELWAAYYPRPKPVAETIALVGLVEKADDRVGRLSGGQRRRLDVALALIGDPELVFLDEPTTGFDPSARRAAWDLVDSLRALGVSIVLTTHHMEEAERLADRIVIIRDGEIVATGTPRTLGGRDGAEAQITFAARSEPPGFAVERLHDGRFRLSSASVAADLHALSGWALGAGVELGELEVRRPTLEDVYLDLTGARR
jgi:ABC-2 type transport system ATP-binding protein